MTKETLNKAIILYNKRSGKIKEYERINDVINANRFNELKLEQNYTTLPIDEEKMREMLIVVRDRLDEEIKVLDKEFAEL